MSSPLLGTIICIMYLDDAGFEEVKKIQNRKRIFPKCSLGDIRVRSVVLNYLILMVPEAGIEPARRCQRGILNPLCLPISPLGLSSITRKDGGAFRSRTGLGGFAIRYITALLTRRLEQILERETRLELATPTLARSCSTN